MVASLAVCFFFFFLIGLHVYSVLFATVAYCLATASQKTEHSQSP